MISVGERSLQVMLAGQAAVQRPHSVQVYESSICFQVKLSSLPTPKLSAFSKSGIGARTPVGSRRRVNTWGAMVRTWECLEYGREQRKTMKASRCMYQKAVCSASAAFTDMRARSHACATP